MADYSDFSRILTQGDIHIFQFRVTEEVAGGAVDISAWQGFWLTAKRSLAEADPGLFQLALGSGLSIIDAPTGLVEAAVAGSLTSSLARRRQVLFSDIQGRDAQGNTWTLLRGKFTILPQVTVI